MSENKKYYWLKLKDNFFNQLVIKKLRKMEHGDTCVIVYLKMQLLAMQNEGVLNYKGIGCDMLEELMLQLDEKEEYVIMTLEYLQKAGVLEMSNNEYTILNIVDVVGKETNSTQRVQKHRANKSKLLEYDESVTDDGIDETSNVTNETNDVTDNETDNVTNNETNETLHCNTEKEKDIEKEKEKNKKEKGLFLEYCEQLCFSKNMIKAVSNWMDYKKEKNQSYKSKGLKTLLNQLYNYQKEYGEEAVINAIEQAMSNNWQGIVWGSLSKQKNVIVLQTDAEKRKQDYMKKQSEAYLAEMRAYAGLA